MSKWPFQWDDSVRFDVNDMLMRVYLRATWVDINRVPFRSGQGRAGDAIERVPAVEPVEDLICKWKTAHMRLIIAAAPQFGPEYGNGFSSDFNSVRRELYREDLKFDNKGDFSNAFGAGFNQGIEGAFSGEEFDSSFDRIRDTDFLGTPTVLGNSFARDEFDKKEFSIN